MTTEEQLKAWIEEILEGGDCYFVGAHTKKTNKFKFFIDCDSGFSLGKSTKINKALRKKMEEGGMFPEGDFSLEISSPGVDEPLQMARQYQKNIGRKLKVEMMDEEEAAVEGRLKSLTESSICLSVQGEKKKDPIKDVEIKLNDIKTAVVQIEFK